MKSVYLAAAVAVVIVLGSVVSSIYVKNVAEKLEIRTEAVYMQIDRDDYLSALEAADELDRQIERSKTLLCAVVDHKDIYEMKRSLEELKCFLDKGEKSESLAHCAAISSLNDKLADNVLPYIFNIL